MSHSRPSPASFREWLASRHEPDTLKHVASQAIDCYESAASLPDGESDIHDLFEAAIHKRFVVWEVGLPLLSRLAERSAPARKKIETLTQDKKMELRRRSIQYLNDFYPRNFCIAVLRKLLSDRSAKVRGLAAHRIEGLDLSELQSDLEQALLTENNEVAHFELEYSLCLLRDSYYEMDNSGYCIALRQIDSGPPLTTWIRQFEGEPLTARRVRELGVDVLRNNVFSRQPLKALRAWAWQSDQGADA
jgi:hypothetical protein